MELTEQERALVQVARDFAQSEQELQMAQQTAVKACLLFLKAHKLRDDQARKRDAALGLSPATPFAPPGTALPRASANLKHRLTSIPTTDAEAWAHLMYVTGMAPPQTSVVPWDIPPAAPKAGAI